MNQPIGFQTAEITQHLNEDWQGTWNKMASFGYKFADMVMFGRGDIAKYKPEDIKKALSTAGLYAINGHFGYSAWNDQYDQTIAWAHEMGYTHAVCALWSTRKTVEDWKGMADELNRIGAKTQKDGIQLGYHNHEIEFVEIDGPNGEKVVPWDILMANTDPKLVKAQLDVGNLTFGGGNAVDVLSKYKDRTWSLHCKDFKPGKASVPVGQGDLDWKKILDIAKSANITNYCTEVGAYGVRTLEGIPLEQSPLDVVESFRQSFVFLNAIQE
jgi:sugar phosphate isomerase/epimerase